MNKTARKASVIRVTMTVRNQANQVVKRMRWTGRAGRGGLDRKLRRRSIELQRELNRRRFHRAER